MLIEKNMNLLLVPKSEKSWGESGDQESGQLNNLNIIVLKSASVKQLMFLAYLVTWIL